VVIRLQRRLGTQCRTQVELEWTYSLVSHEDRMNEREEMEHWQQV
jgi:plasmid maintenance system antidote protein VapI